MFKHHLETAVLSTLGKYSKAESKIWKEEDSERWSTSLTNEVEKNGSTDTGYSWRWFKVMSRFSSLLSMAWLWLFILFLLFLSESPLASGLFYWILSIFWAIITLIFLHVPWFYMLGFFFQHFFLTTLLNMYNLNI